MVFIQESADEYRWIPNTSNYSSVVRTTINKNTQSKVKHYKFLKCSCFSRKLVDWWVGKPVWIMKFRKLWVRCANFLNFNKNLRVICKQMVNCKLSWNLLPFYLIHLSTSSVLEALHHFDSLNCTDVKLFRTMTILYTN